jgi:predicted secreted protein
MLDNRDIEVINMLIGLVSLVGLVNLALVGAASKQVYDIDNAREVKLEVGGDVYLALTSNASTGYSWSIMQPDSLYIEVQGSLSGEYMDSNSDLIGAPGKQVFHIGCTSYCVDGAEAEVQFVYQRSWENEPTEAKLITVNIVSTKA